MEVRSEETSSQSGTLRWWPPGGVSCAVINYISEKIQLPRTRSFSGGREARKKSIDRRKNKWLEERRSSKLREKIGSQCSELGISVSLVCGVLLFVCWQTQLALQHHHQRRRKIPIVLRRGVKIFASGKVCCGPTPSEKCCVVESSPFWTQTSVGGRKDPVGPAERQILKTYTPDYLCRGGLQASHSSSSSISNSSSV